MLGAAKPDPFRAEGDRIGHLLGRIGVCAHAKGAELVRPSHQFLVFPVGKTFLRCERTVDQHLHNFRGRSCNFAGKDFTGRSIDRDVISLVQGCAIRTEGALLIIDFDPDRAADAHFAHLPRDQRRV